MAFECPACGSDRWGSTALADGTYQRHCNGPTCKFTWHQSEDALVGVPVAAPEDSGVFSALRKVVLGGR